MGCPVSSKFVIMALASACRLWESTFSCADGMAQLATTDTMARSARLRTVTELVSFWFPIMLTVPSVFSPKSHDAGNGASWSWGPRPDGLDRPRDAEDPGSLLPRLLLLLALMVLMAIPCLQEQ